MRIPTTEELSAMQNREPEDRLHCPPETDQHENMRNLITKYQSIFLQLARDAGYEIESRPWPECPPLTYEYQFRAVITEDLTTIERALEDFKRSVLAEVRQHKAEAMAIMGPYYSHFFQEQVKNGQGKVTIDRLSKRLDLALQVYPLVNPDNQQFEWVATKLGYKTTSHDCAAVRKVKVAYRDAVRLIAGAASGTFLDALSQAVRD